MPERLDLTVRNAGVRMLDTVTVELDTSYASRFSRVEAIPGFVRAYAIELIDIAPGETRRSLIELEGRSYGRHSGELRVTAGGPDTVRLRLGAFIYP
jgi:hypothetical protein